MVKPILYGMYSMGRELREEFSQKVVFAGCVRKKENMYCLGCETKFCRPTCVHFDIIKEAFRMLNVKKIT